MPKALLKFKNYDVHAVTTVSQSRLNANIATWIMQSAMQQRFLTVALYKTDYTIELVRESGLLNVNLLGQDQTGLITKLGRKSGRETNKFARLPYALDERGCPYLTEAIGYAQCVVHDRADSGDHEIFVCQVLAQRLLHPEAVPMTQHFLREKGLVRG